MKKFIFLVLVQLCHIILQSCAIAQITSPGHTTYSGANLSGQILLSDGSANSPSLGFTNNTDIGLFHLTNGLSITVNGTEAWRFYAGANYAPYSGAPYIDVTGKSFQFNGDVNTGLFYISQDSAYIGAGGALLRLGSSGVDMKTNGQYYGQRDRWEKAFTIKFDTTFADTIWPAVVNKTGALVKMDTVTMVADSADFTVEMVLRTFASTSTTRDSLFGASAVAGVGGDQYFRKITSFPNNIASHKQVGLVISVADYGEISFLLEGSYTVQKKVLTDE